MIPEAAPSAKFEVWCLEMGQWETPNIFLKADGTLWHHRSSLMPLLMPLKQETHTIVPYIGITDQDDRQIKLWDIIEKSNGDHFIVTYNPRRKKYQLGHMQNNYAIDYWPNDKIGPEILRIVGNRFETPELIPETFLGD